LGSLAASEHVVTVAEAVAWNDTKVPGGPWGGEKKSHVTAAYAGFGSRTEAERKIAEVKSSKTRPMELTGRPVNSEQH
jgi:hypothetical protein